MALFHLVRINRRVLPQLAQVEGWDFLINGMQNGPSVVQQAFLNILNMVMVSAAVCTVREPSQLAAERRVRETLFGSFSETIRTSLLRLTKDVSSDVTTSKALLSITLYLRIHPHSLPALLEQKLLQTIQQLVAQQPIDKYMEECLDIVITDVLYTVDQSIITATQFIHKRTTNATMLKYIGHTCLPTLLHISTNRFMSQLLPVNPLVSFLSLLIKFPATLAEHDYDIGKQFVHFFA